jgi:hypothetical protein
MFPPAIWNWVTNSILLDNSMDSSFFLLTPLNDTPYRRMGMSYQVEELVAPAFAHVAGSGITVDCGIWYVPNGLARRPLPSSCVERMEHQTQSPRLLLKRHYEHLQI